MQQTEKATKSNILTIFVVFVKQITLYVKNGDNVINDQNNHPKSRTRALLLFPNNQTQGPLIYVIAIYSNDFLFFDMCCFLGQQTFVYSSMTKISFKNNKNIHIYI